MLFLWYVCEFACSASTVPPRAAGSRTSYLREQTKRLNDDAPLLYALPPGKEKTTERRWFFDTLAGCRILSAAAVSWRIYGSLPSDELVGCDEQVEGTDGAFYMEVQEFVDTQVKLHRSLRQVQVKL